MTVQVWTLDPKKEFADREAVDMTDIENIHYVANIRGHKGFITTALWSRFDQDCIMTCSDDQSVKIWNLVNIKYRFPPKKKKEQKLGELKLEAEPKARWKDDKDYDKIDSKRFAEFTSKKKKVENSES